MTAPGKRHGGLALTFYGALCFFSSLPALLFAAGNGDAADEHIGVHLAGPGVSNHPVRVVPSRGITIPEGWPLAEDGSITCKTCHSFLRSQGRDVRARLRNFDADSEDPAAFCAKCHASQAEPTAAGMHWRALSVAHVGSGNSRGSRAAGLFDADTQACLGCHDGVSASESKNSTAWNPSRGSMANQTGNHPVGIRYGRRSRRGGGSPLRPAIMLPKEVRLPGGMVSCVSCHDLYAPAQFYLTVPLDGSKLCFTCHELD